MPEHLLRVGAVYYYRRRVPDDVRERLGRSVLKYSLKTQKLAEAKRRRISEDAKWEAQFDLLRGVDGPSDAAPALPARTGDDVVRAAQEFVLRMHERTAGRLRQDGPGTEAERAEMIQNVEMDLETLTNRDDPRGYQRITAAERDIFASEGVTGSVSGPEIEDVVRRALIELDRRKLGIIQDRHDQVWIDPLFDPTQPPRTTVSELVEQFLGYKGEEAEAYGLSQKNFDKQAAQAKLIAEILGPDRQVSRIGYDDCRAACATLARVPANRTKLYPAAQLHDAIRRAAHEGKKTLSFISQQQYLGSMKEILALAVKKRLLPVNPAEDLRPLTKETRSADQKREPFVLEQLHAFFGSDYYRGCSRRQGCLEDPSGWHWRFWLPLLMTFSGLRPREVLQLYTSDLQRTKKGTWFLDLVATGDEELSATAPEFAKSLKTAGSRRQVPLHPELIKIGFLHFVASQARSAQAGNPQLFPGLKPNKYGDPAWYPLKRFREVFLAEAIAMQPRQSVYSFRHTWRDALRRVKATDDALKALGGWAEGMKTSDAYGSKLQPDLYAEYIEAIAYEGLDLSHLYASAAASSPAADLA